MPRIFLEMDADREPFERQTKEGDKAWWAFAHYRDTGEHRTLAETNRAYMENFGIKGKEISHYQDISAMAKANHWRDRVDAWESMLDTINRKRRIEEIKTMQFRFIEYGKSLQRLGIGELKKWLEKSSASEKQILRLHELIKVLETGIQLEKANRDLPGSQLGTLEVVGKTEDDKREGLRKVLQNEDAMELIDKVVSLPDNVVKLTGNDKK